MHPGRSTGHEERSYPALTAAVAFNEGLNRYASGGWRDRTVAATPCDGYSLRQVAQRCGVTPAYLSRVERGKVGPPGEETLLNLARELKDDPDVLLALAGKISSDLRAVIVARPKLFADLIRQLKNAPDHAVLRIVREVSDGDW